jgi:hypothetical protein
MERALDSMMGNAVQWSQIVKPGSAQSALKTTRNREFKPGSES